MRPGHPRLGRIICVPSASITSRVAAAIAAVVTICTGIISLTVSEHQKQLEAQKATAQAELATQKAAADAKLQQLKHENDARLQQLRTGSDMILEVVRTYNPDQAATNLQFLVDAGLVPMTAPRLASYLRNRPPGTGKFLPPPGNQPPINPPRSR
jgi:hypothetical protein